MVLQWMQVCDWFMERTHESGYTDADIELPEFENNFELFESTSLAIVRGVSTFFDNTLVSISTNIQRPANVLA